MASYARYDWPFLDRKTLDDMGDAYAGAAASGRLPSLVWGHLLGPDEVAHAEGPGSEEFHATLASIDKAFGRLVKRLKKMKAEDRVLFVLVGDHGNRTYHTFVDASELVNRVLRANPTEADCTKGDCVLVPAPRKDKDYDVADAMIAVGAYRGAMIWLPSEHQGEEIPAAFRTRKQKRQTGPPAPRLRMPAVSVFAAAPAPPRCASSVRAAPRPDRSSSTAGGPLRNRARDPATTPRPATRTASSRARTRSATPPIPRCVVSSAPRTTRTVWLDATATGPYPDLVVQLPEFFDSPRAPDVFVSPAEGYGFTSGKAAGHGSSAAARPWSRSCSRARRAAGPPPRGAHRRPRADAPDVPRRPLRPRGDGRRRPGDRPRRSARHEAAAAHAGVTPQAAERSRTTFVAPAVADAPDTSTIVAPARRGTFASSASRRGSCSSTSGLRDPERHDVAEKGHLAAHGLAGRERHDRKPEAELRHEPRRPSRLRVDDDRRCARRPRRGGRGAARRP